MRQYQFVTSEDFTLSVTYAAGGSYDLSVGYAFYAAPVPVPAAGILLATALAGMGIATTRRKKA